MDIIIYSQPDNLHKTALLKKVSEFIHISPVMVFDLDGLFQLLRSKISGKVIVLFLITTEKELDRMRTDRAYLFNTKFIIVLPEKGKDIEARGLFLQPRYLGYVQDGFFDVCSVLKKMIEKYGSQP